MVGTWWPAPEKLRGYSRCAWRLKESHGLQGAWGRIDPSQPRHWSASVRVVVSYLEARPQRMREPFGDLTTEALRDAWPRRCVGISMAHRSGAQAIAQKTPCRSSL